MNDFASRVEAIIPRLRRYARALTRNEVAADDLVQDLPRPRACQAAFVERRHRPAGLAVHHPAQSIRVRLAVRQGELAHLSETHHSLSHAAAQGHSLELRDLDRALAKLPAEQRTVILMVGLEGMSYDAVAEVIGVPVGTVRSRLSRGREALRHLMGIVPDRRAEARQSARERSTDTHIAA
jgi:RNA polymerase sigma-70 factor, ECF subfamily